MRVLICHEGDGAAQHRQRAVTPAAGLTRAGVPTYTASVSLHPRDGGIIRGLDPTGRHRVLPPTDVVVLRLLDQDESASIGRARRAGQLVYVDLDDDVWNMPEWIEARRWLRRDGRYLHGPPLGAYTGNVPRSIDLGLLERNMAQATGVIVSTPALAESVREHVPDVPVHVVRNAIDPGLYRRRQPAEHTPLRIGWMGTTTSGHVKGLQDMALRLAEVVKDYGAEFWHLGASPGDPPLEDMLPGWPAPISHMAWRPNRELPHLLEQIDVAVICRPPHRFHEAQSNVTGLAYMAAGVPFVASHTAEYALLTPYTYRTPWEFSQWLGELVGAWPEWRYDWRERARRDLQGQWTPERMGRELRDLFAADMAVAAHL